MAGELLDDHRRCPAPAQLCDEEVPKRMHAPAFEAGSGLCSFEGLQQAGVAAGLTVRGDADFVPG